MLGAFNLHPLLKGWEYTDLTTPTKILVTGTNPVEVYRVEEEGWLLGASMLATDSYATTKITFQGADLQTRILITSAEAARLAGAWQQDPAGWLQRYFRPLQASTAGIFLTVINSSGFQGNPLPYYRTVIIEQYLDSQSTEQSCSANATIYKIAITDKKRFIRTLRKVLAIKDEKIDEELLKIG